MTVSNFRWLIVFGTLFFHKKFNEALTDLFQALSSPFHFTPRQLQKFVFEMRVFMFKGLEECFSILSHFVKHEMFHGKLGIDAQS